MKRSNVGAAATSKKPSITDRKLFNDKVWDTQFTKDLQNTIADSKPFQWGCVQDLLEPTFLAKVKTEILQNIHFTLKETDIYKLNQTGDLANLSKLGSDELQSKLPHVWQLRQLIYSDEFRNFISTVTQCGPLSGVKTDLSCHIYDKHCHLLNHDDVVGSRRVSFILYLNDPHHQWKDHYGGNLRLFDTVTKDIPLSDPVAKLLPKFNQYAFFKVQPGYSFHDVEEVRINKKRLSIQGWFHIPQNGEVGYNKGEEEKWCKSICQIDEKKLKDYTFPKRAPATVQPLSDSLDLTEEDIRILGEFIAPHFLNKDKLESLRDQFLNNSYISVVDFLNDAKAGVLSKLIKDNELNVQMPTKQTEIAQPWDLARPPHQWQFLYLEEKNNTNASKFTHLDKELAGLSSFFKSLPFQKFVIKVTGLTPLTVSSLVRRFRPGFDYMLADKTELNKALENVMDCVLEGTLCLTPMDGWDTNSVGGYELYMTAENEEKNEWNDEDPTVVGRDGDSTLINKPASWNSFNLVLRDQDVLEFVKYVSWDAKCSRWDLKLKWDLLDDDDDDEE
ncbi:oxidative DNA demethylase KNAG_0L01350 [Huiozyma naganishii CBS 8797]|uniref:uS12 prolyl 3,4-dihydroxylase n=1 Tax=Huiozyma naganishii (strain ATCC MYA-139 / BCRC 22969 / CBS 8797 / KCTC 17520 / NBRC 10181 / NCYC 3082 / Yp74L-3) TaxID=1071383 RepID=J7RCZ4_HUIN7|nr:hypothetical protein KNAG_0L01350 [Kazachstania naganishii CBS 8797]CCK72755.1 hypothetical protein KNAG_0L01350 [Kazachstania naganishii CBS 8797]